MNKKSQKDQSSKKISEGRTKIPAEVIINKMGSSVILNIVIDIKKFLASQKQKSEIDL